MEASRKNETMEAQTKSSCHKNPKHGGCPRGPYEVVKVGPPEVQVSSKVNCKVTAKAKIRLFVLTRKRGVCEQCDF